MRKNMMRIGTMALVAAMMSSPTASVFAADESQETVIAAEEDVSDIDTDNTITSTDNDINMTVIRKICLQRSGKMKNFYTVQSIPLIIMQQWIILNVWD